MIGSTTPGVIHRPAVGGRGGGRGQVQLRPGIQIDPSRQRAGRHLQICYVRGGRRAGEDHSGRHQPAGKMILGSASEGGFDPRPRRSVAQQRARHEIPCRHRLSRGSTRRFWSPLKAQQEISGRISAWARTAMYSQRPDWIAKGFIAACSCRRTLAAIPDVRQEIGRMQRVPSTSRENLPKARQIMELAKYTQQAFGRPYLLPPGTPGPIAWRRCARSVHGGDAGCGPSGRSPEDARRGAGRLVRPRYPGAGVVK